MMLELRNKIKMR